MKRKKTVSLCMIVKNEEKYLERCLNSVEELVDEIIIVDTGSTDNTVEIAKKYGANVAYYQWDNNFSNARNFSLQHASKEWILLMDGDDEFQKEDYETFIKVVNTSKKDGHFFKTLSFAGVRAGKDIVSNLNIRLLRNNKKYEFKGAIHEQITCIDGKMDYKKFSTEDISILHYGYLTDAVVEKNKRSRNITIIERELKKDPHNRFHLFNLGNEYFAMGDQEKALEFFNKAYKNIDYNIGYSSKLVIRRIMCLDELGRYNEALQAIDEGIRAYPKFTDLELIRGWIQLKNKRYTLAIDSFKKCIALGQPPVQYEFINGAGTYRPYQALGEIYFQFEDYQKSLQCFEKVLKINPYLQSSVYKIGTILNKCHENKKYVSHKIAQYFNIEYALNLILIADVLMCEGLYDVATGYLEKAKELDTKNDKIILLLGKALFYQKKYAEAMKIFSALPESSGLYQESLRYVFIYNIIHEPNDISDTLAKIQQNTQAWKYKVYLQLYNVFIGKDEIVFSDEDNHEKILELVMNILGEVMKTHEFEIFETLLNALNCIESNQVLLALGKLYYHNGFKPMAVKEILKSVKEFNTIDARSVEILYKTM